MMLAMALFVCALGVYLLDGAKVAGGVLIGLIVTAIGARIVWNLRKVWRAIWNQRRWPMEDWRVNDKVGGATEWERWNSSSPDEWTNLWS
jgi:hypothetical protein